MKGIILAGGKGTRLHPVTQAVSKQLLPIYDKPMVYYPLSTLLLAGIRDILLISTPTDLPRYEDLLGDGERIGVKISYAEQSEPRGIADAFRIGRDFIGDDDVTLVLGDNVFYGQGLSEMLQNAVQENTGATVFGYYVKEPERYGVASFDADGRVVDIIEKPDEPPSNYAITGLYMYDNRVIDIAENLTPSDRGELEITDVNRTYLEQGALDMVRLGRGAAWLDTGTHQALHEASSFIATVERRQGLKVACIEEVAYNMGYIDEDKLRTLAKEAPYKAYGEYLHEVLRINETPHEWEHARWSNKHGGSR